MNEKKSNFLLFGHASYLNRGCEAIVTGLANVVNELDADSRITVATFDVENDKYKHRDLIDKYVAHRWSPEISQTEKDTWIKDGKEIEEMAQKNVIDEIGKNDLCISVGGDNYCYKDNLEFLRTVDNNVKGKKKKLILFGASINEDVVTDQFLDDIMRFDMIIVRESLTYGLLEKFIDRDRLMLSPDIAFSLQPQNVKELDEFDNNGSDGIVGINLSPLFMEYQKGNKDVLSAIKGLIDYVLKNYNYKIALIPHVYLPGGNDLDVLEKIKEYYDDNERVFLVNKKRYSCRELKFIISKCRFLIAARTHASIAGYSSAIPTLVLSYSIKSKGIAKDIFGDYSDYVIPVNLIDVKRLKDKFEFLRKNEKSIKKTLSEKIPSYAKESRESVKEMISKIERLEKNNITKKEECSGCGACANSCPQSVIEMRPDHEGFLHPVINNEKCNNCGICKKICPNNNDYIYDYDGISSFACKNVSEEERINSSSGGVFSLLAKNILSKKGIVFGAIYDDYDVKHIKIEDKSDLKFLRGSKYVESTIGDCYKLAKEALNDGKIVLFSGVPCQIEGLKSFLGKNYHNLFCISVICHGVPSKKIFLSHSNELENKFGDKLIRINFRNKESGWKNYQMEYVFESKNIKVKSSDDYFMQGFLRNFFLRRSCYSCDFRLFKKNTSDIILGDFWGIENSHKNFDDDKGVSAVIINSQKGATFFQEIKNSLVFEKSNINRIALHNSNLLKPVAINKERFGFFDVFDRMGFGFAIDHFMRKEEILNLSKKLSQSEMMLEKMKEEIHFSHSQLTEVLNSRKWKIMKRFSKIFNVFFPHGTQRRKILRIGYKKGVGFVCNKKES